MNLIDDLLEIIAKYSGPDTLENLLYFPRVAQTSYLYRPFGSKPFGSRPFGPPGSIIMELVVDRGQSRRLVPLLFWGNSALFEEAQGRGLITPEELLHHSVRCDFIDGIRCAIRVFGLHRVIAECILLQALKCFAFIIKNRSVVERIAGTRAPTVDQIESMVRSHSGVRNVFYANRQLYADGAN